LQPQRPTISASSVFLILTQKFLIFSETIKQFLVIETILSVNIFEVFRESMIGEFKYFLASDKISLSDAKRATFSIVD
jgi:hypothetical protein